MAYVALLGGFLQEPTDYFVGREQARNYAAERLGDVYLQSSRLYGWDNALSPRDQVSPVPDLPVYSSTGTPFPYSDGSSGRKFFHSGRPATVGIGNLGSGRSQESRNLQFQTAKRLGRDPWVGEFVFEQGESFAGGCPERVLQGRFAGTPDFHAVGATLDRDNDAIPGVGWAWSDPAGFMTGPLRAHDWRLQQRFTARDRGIWNVDFSRSDLRFAVTVLVEQGFCGFCGQSFFLERSVRRSVQA